MNLSALSWTNARCTASQTSVSRATAFNSSLSRRAAAREVLSQLDPAPDVRPVRPPDAICRAAYGDAAAATSMGAEDAEVSSPAQTATASDRGQDGDRAQAAGPAAAASGLTSGELLPAAARQVGDASIISRCPLCAHEFDVV